MSKSGSDFPMAEIPILVHSTNSQFRYESQVLMGQMDSNGQTLPTITLFLNFISRFHIQSISRTRLSEASTGLAPWRCREIQGAWLVDTPGIGKPGENPPRCQGENGLATRSRPAFAGACQIPKSGKSGRT